MIGIESFVTAIACLCASTYGPLTNSSINDLESNIVDALSNSDRNFLKIFFNSKTQFSIPSTFGNCALPDPDDFNSRLDDLELSLKKQRELSHKLKKELHNLSSNQNPTSALAPAPACAYEAKDAEIKALQQRIAVLEKNAEKPALDSKKSSLYTNVCLLTKKQGISDVIFTWPYKVFCDQSVDKKYGSGWMLQAQRLDGSIHFYRNWAEYAKGFGSVSSKGEFFMGLETLNILTNNHIHELLFVLTDNKNVKRYAHYDSFVIGNESEQFALKYLGEFKGDAGDSLRYHVGQKFSTFDRDNDESAENCAIKHSGAWWYKNCFESNLFGVYETKRTHDAKHPRNGMIWTTFHADDGLHLISMRMYVKPKVD